MDYVFESTSWITKGTLFKYLDLKDPLPTLVKVLFKVKIYTVLLHVQRIMLPTPTPKSPLDVSH